MTTLSAIECYRLSDCGKIAPERVADFCVLADGDVFTIDKVYKGSVPAAGYPGNSGSNAMSVGADSVQKIVPVNWYEGSGFSVDFAKRFEMQMGAIATSISHDANNLIVTNRFR
jgi:adenine deaminase